MAAQLFYLPFPVAFTSNGLPASGARLKFYEPGTTTPKQVWADDALSVSAGSVVTANGAGRFGSLYLDSAETYRLIVEDRHGAELADIDPLTPGVAAGSELLQPFADQAAASAQAAGNSETAAGASETNAAASANAAAQSETNAAASETGAAASAGSAAASEQAVADALAAVPDGELTVALASEAGFTLIKHKRSGTNTFARTAGQLAALGSESDFSIMHWIDPAQDEAVLDGSIAVDQAASFTNALTDIGALAGKKGLILPPGVTLRNDSGMDLHVDNLVVQAHGAKIVSALSTTDPLIQVTGEDVQILGLSTLLTAAATTAHHFRLIGARPKIHMCSMDYAVDQNTPGFYIKQADGAEVTHCRFRGANAFMGYIEGSDLLLAFNDLDAAPGGDDAFALKAINRPSENIRIIGNRIKGFATMLSIGSNVGMNLADDPTHSRYVANVIFADNVGDTCGGMLTIRPGGTAGQDYRDGVVDGLTFSNNRMRDPTGAKATHLLQITPGQRGAVRNVKGDKNAFMGRMNVASQFGLFVFRSVGDQSSLDNFDIELDCFDPFAGAANGALITAAGALGADPVEGYDVGDAVPGYPMESLTNIDPTAVTCSRINIRMSADGTSVNGVSMLAGGDDALSIEKLRLANFNATNNANAAGVRALSRIRMTGDAITIGTSSKIHASTNKAYRCDDGTTGAIISAHSQIYHVPDCSAGSDVTCILDAPSRNAYAAKIEFLSHGGITQSADTTNYMRVGVYDLDNTNTLISSFNTASSGQAVTADTFTKIVEGKDLSAANTGKLHFTRAQRLKFELKHFGTGNTVTGNKVRVIWAYYG